MIYLLYAFLIGMAVSMFSFGPTSVVALRKSYTTGFAGAMMVGLGSAVADGVYAMIPAYGLSHLAEQLELYRIWIELGAAGMMVAFGLYFILSRKTPQQHTATRKEKYGALGMGVLLNLINPGNGIAYITAFALMGLLSVNADWQLATGFVVAVFLGSIAAWVLKVGIFVWTRRWLTEDNINKVETIIGYALIIGAVVLACFTFFG